MKKKQNNNVEVKEVKKRTPFETYSKEDTITYFNSNLEQFL